MPGRPAAPDFIPSPELFPFTSRFFESSVGPVHYIDEGEGPALVLLHGNPDWCFLYRKIVVALRDRFRCVAIDYPGFGLSVHPTSYGYTAPEHAHVVGELVDHLMLDDMTVMGQDWGGPIGLSVAADRAGRVSRLVMGNTWYWPADWRMSAFSLLMSSLPMQYLIVHHGAFFQLMRHSIKADITKEEFDHYLDVMPSADSRRGVAQFPKQIRNAGPWLADLERRVNAWLLQKPLLLTWGTADPAFGPFLDRFKGPFQDVNVVELRSAGHYFQEDAPIAVAEAIAAHAT